MAEAGKGKRQRTEYRVIEGGGGGDDVRFSTGGGGGGGEDPPATRGYVDSQVNAMSDDLNKRMISRRNEVIGAIVAAVIAVVGAGAWAFGVLREDISGAETRAERAADRIEGRLDQALSRQEAN